MASFKKRKKEIIKFVKKDTENNFIDKNSIYHFIFGSILGFSLNLFFKSLLFSLILGILLIPLLEYLFHKVIIGYSNLITKNALTDIFIAFIGFLFFLFLFNLIFYQ